MVNVAVMGLLHPTKNKAGGVMFDFVEPEGLFDVFVNGIARVESLGDGYLTRVWLFADEHLQEPSKVIRARLVMPIGQALEMNDEAAKAFRQIHRISHPLKIVSG